MKFLIADDEVLARITVQKALNECGIDNSHIQTADCGNRMVEILSHSKIDVAFVDIKMHDISGLDAIRKCLSVAPDTSFYILTGYERFDYAAEAIHLGVRDFLLKPLSLSTMLKILEKENARCARKKERESVVYTAEITRILLEPQAELTKNMREIVCLPSYIHSYEPIDSYDKHLTKLIGDYPMIHPVTIKRENGIAVLFCLTGDLYLVAIENAISDMFQTYLNAPSAAENAVFIMNRFIPLTEIKATIYQLESYSDIQILAGSGRFYRFHPQMLERQSLELSVAVLLAEIRSCYLQTDYSAYAKTVADLQRILTKDSASALIIDNTYLLHWLKRYFSWKENRITDVKMLITFFNEQGEVLLSKTEEQVFQIDDIIAYLKDHYKEDISVASVASDFGISPNYLSTKFKKDCGIKFTDYLTNLRIIESKKLLRETNMQVKDIARQVGYYTASHFIRSFVKSEGKTPLEYRNSVVTS